MYQINALWSWCHRANTRRDMCTRRALHNTMSAHEDGCRCWMLSCRIMRRWRGLTRIIHILNFKQCNSLMLISWHGVFETCRWMAIPTWNYWLQKLPVVSFDRFFLFPCPVLIDSQTDSKYRPSMPKFPVVKISKCWIRGKQICCQDDMQSNEYVTTGEALAGKRVGFGW